MTCGSVGPIDVSVQEDTPYELYMRVTAFNGSGAASPVANEGNLVTQANVSSIAVKAYDMESGEQNGTTLAPVVADTIYNTLQTTGIWARLTNGGNCRIVLPATFFPTGSKQVQIETTFTLSDASIIRGRPVIANVAGLFQS